MLRLKYYFISHRLRTCCPLRERKSLQQVITKKFQTRIKKAWGPERRWDPRCFFCCWEAKLSRGWIFQYFKTWHITHPVIPNLMNSRLMLDFRFQSLCRMDFSPDLQCVAKWQPQHLSFRKARGFFQTSNGIIWPSTTCFSWPGDFFLGHTGAPISSSPGDRMRPPGMWTPRAKSKVSHPMAIRFAIASRLVRQSGQIKRGNENQGYSLLIICYWTVAIMFMILLRWYMNGYRWEEPLRSLLL